MKIDTYNMKSVYSLLYLSIKLKQSPKKNSYYAPGTDHIIIIYKTQKQEEKPTIGKHLGWHQSNFKKNLIPTFIN